MPVASVDLLRRASWASIFPASMRADERLAFKSCSVVFISVPLAKRDASRSRLVAVLARLALIHYRHGSYRAPRVQLPI